MTDEQLKKGVRISGKLFDYLALLMVILIVINVISNIIISN